MTMQSCYQHLLHEQCTDKNNACKAVDIGKCHTLMHQFWAKHSNPHHHSTALKFWYQIPQTVSQHRSRASLIYALIALAQCLVLHRYGHAGTHELTYVVNIGLQQRAANALWQLYSLHPYKTECTKVDSILMNVTNHIRRHVRADVLDVLHSSRP